MADVTVQKRGEVYQYKFEIASIDGKRKFKNKSGFATKSEAKQAGIIAYNEYLNTGHSFKPKTMSYSDYLDYWMKEHCEINLKYHTIEAYKNIIKNHIKPKLGFYRLCQITTATIQEFVNNTYVEYGYSKNFMKNILKVLKTSFTYATDVVGFVKENPTVKVKLPKYDKPDEDPAHIFTKEEVDIILNRFKKNHCAYYAMLTAYHTGLRVSEVFGLTWNDIDLENGTISIKHNVYDKPKDAKGRWFIGSTKTFAGKRIIHISETLLNALKNYQKKQQLYQKLYGKKYNYYHIEDVINEYGKAVERRIVINDNTKKYKEKINLVFTKENGLYVGTDLTRYPFKIIHNELGIEKCRFYDLRGSYATKILTNGIEIRDVADILGHRNVETTENYYISSTEKSRRLATDVFDKITKSEIIEEIIKYE